MFGPACYKQGLTGFISAKHASADMQGHGLAKAYRGKDATCSFLRMFFGKRKNLFAMP